MRHAGIYLRVVGIHRGTAAIAFFRLPGLGGLAALLIGLLLVVAPARAGDLPDVPPDGWWWYYGQTAEEVGALLSSNNARLTSIQVEQASPLRFTVTMVRNAGAYQKGWWWYFGQTADEIGNHARELNARVISLDAYQDGDQLRFAAVYISNTGADAKGWWWYFGQEPDRIGQLVQQNHARLIDLRQYTFGSFTRYAVVMVDNSGSNSLGWWWYFNISAADVATNLQHNGGYLVSLQVANPSAPTFNVIMNKLPTPGGRGWWWYFGESAEVLADLYDRNMAWMHDVKTYQLGGQQVFTALMLGFPTHPAAVITHHYDNDRTGWNSNEPTLNPTNVASSRFDLRHTVALDDQVDVQPLVVPGLAEVGGNSTGGHDVVYVATENNTVYALDATTGAVLAQRNLGAPVRTPLNCNNNGPNVGVNGTPVIDVASRTIYLVTYGTEGGAPVHRIHALDITSLADRVPAPVVTASHALSGGGTIAFDSRRQRQRAGLLAANGNVYVGFASYCDFEYGNSRGWVLGWRQGTLTPLAANELTNKLPSSPNNFFLSSVWMSGYGLAADRNGYVYAVTGNADKSGTTYDPARNPSESVIKMASDLSRVADLFTPSNASDLDKFDVDFGSGGALVVPAQNGDRPNLIAAAGKDGRMFVLNADSMGGFTPGGPDKYIAEQDIGGCWCGQSYFADPGGVIVASGSTTITLWRIRPSPVALVNAGSSQPLFSHIDNVTPNDPGFFTTISSFGAGQDVVIWAVSRPDSTANPQVFLYAFSTNKDPTGHLALLRRLPAGSWPNLGGNANIFPVVANGRVFVATNKQLSIYGLQ